MDIGIKLKLLREKRNFTQEYVANELGIGQSAYFNLEAGKTKLSIDKATKLADLYNVPVSLFFSDTHPISNYNTGDHSRSIFNSQIQNEDNSEYKTLYERIIFEKNQQIEFLAKELDNCREEKETIQNMLSSILLKQQ